MDLAESLVEPDTLGWQRPGIEICLSVPDACSDFRRGNFFGRRAVLLGCSQFGLPAGADPEPQDRGCRGDVNEIAININTKSARIASYTSPFLYGLWLVMVGKGGWRERNVGKRGYLLSYETALHSTLPVIHLSLEY